MVWDVFNTWWHTNIATEIARATNAIMQKSFAADFVSSLPDTFQAHGKQMTTSPVRKLSVAYIENVSYKEVMLSFVEFGYVKRETKLTMKDVELDEGPARKPYRYSKQFRRYLQRLLLGHAARKLRVMY